MFFCWIVGVTSLYEQQLFTDFCFQLNPFFVHSLYETWNRWFTEVIEFWFIHWNLAYHIWETPTSSWKTKIKGIIMTKLWLLFSLFYSFMCSSLFDCHLLVPRYPAFSKTHDISLYQNFLSFLYSITKKKKRYIVC